MDTVSKKVIVKRKRNTNSNSNQGVNTIDKDVINVDTLNYENEYSSCNDIEKKMRIEVASKLFEILPKQLKNKAIIIEKSIFLEVSLYSKQKNIYPSWDNKRFRRFYTNKIVSILNHLNPNSYIKNYYLLSKIENGEVDVEKLATMSAQEIYPENWQQLIRKKKETERILYSKKHGTTTNYKCRRCKHNEADYYESQVRSCDEPMTIFLSCLNCGFKWNVS